MKIRYILTFPTIPLSKTLGMLERLLNNKKLSPHRFFTVDEWAKLRADTPMTLTQEEITKLQSVNDPTSIEEVEHIYLPLSRLLSFYVGATKNLYQATAKFLTISESKMPFVIGIAGSVAVGKSTTARLLKELLARWPGMPKVELVTTDGFLYPNKILEEKGIMDKKGFPESYNFHEIIRFLSEVKAGKDEVIAPIYSHLSYDVIPNQFLTINRPDILILEGLNVLQTKKMPIDEKKALPFVSDFFDFSIYIDADENAIEQWYIERFLNLKDSRFNDPRSYFKQYANISTSEAKKVAKQLWQNINLINLHYNIYPTKPRADLILTKGFDHQIIEVALRKI